MSYLPLEKTPTEITISTYWRPGNGIWYLREALGIDHPENLWNWFRKEYPDINPDYFGIKNPLVEIKKERFEGKTRDELIEEILHLEKMINAYGL
jgi:hypothetical protein